MDTSQPAVVEVERVNSEVLIGFSDGRTALYSSALLHSILPQAKELRDLDEEEDE